MGLVISKGRLELVPQCKVFLHTVSLGHKLQPYIFSIAWCSCFLKFTHISLTLSPPPPCLPSPPTKSYFHFFVLIREYGGGYLWSTNNERGISMNWLRPETHYIHCQANQINVQSLVPYSAPVYLNSIFCSKATLKFGYLYMVLVKDLFLKRVRVKECPTVLEPPRRG